MSVLVSACISYHLAVNMVLATNSTDSDNDDTTMKALLTVGILVGFLVIALVVAKIVDSCYDHHIAINDNASDISEDTRKLVRLRLTVNAFRKRKATNDTEITSPSEKQRRIIRIWSSRARESRRLAEQRRAEASPVKPSDKKSIIKVEEASGEAKITAASVAVTFLTLSETAGRRTGRLSPRSGRSPNRLSPNMTPTSQSPKLKVNGQKRLLSPRPSPKASPTALQKSQPDLQRTITGLDVDKNKAAAASAANKTSSGNGFLGVPVDRHLDGCGGALHVEFSEDQDVCPSAIELGQDSVRSEVSVGLVALSCRPDISQFSALVLPGLDTTDSGLVEKHSKNRESQNPESTEPNPPQVTVTQTVVTSPPASENDTVPVENDQKESGKDALSPSDHSSLRTSTPSFSDPVGTHAEPEHSGKDPRDSEEEEEEEEDEEEEGNKSKGFHAEKPKSRNIFTIVLPTEQPCPAAYSPALQSGRQPGNEPFRSLDKAAASSRFRDKERGRARAQTFSVADMSRVCKMSPQLAHTARVYAGIRDVFRVRKDFGSKKKNKAAVSKMDQSSDIPSSSASSVAADTSDRRQSVDVVNTAGEMQTTGGKF